VRSLEAATVIADMELTFGGRLWARVTGWEDRRLESNDRVWLAYREPEKHLFSYIRDDGYSFFHDFYRTSRSREYLSRRYLAEAERDEYSSSGAVGPRKQRQWLAERVAAKDAVRSWLWAHGHGPLFPAEIVISNEPDNRLRVSGPYSEDLRISTAHLDEIAVAIAAEGTALGIAIRSVDPNEESARFVSAKEAVAKARGQEGADLDRYSIVQVDKDHAVVDGMVVQSRREGNYIVSWTSI
jgi:phosphopantetheinyl transferase (holo-ACP synthase)